MDISRKTDYSIRIVAELVNANGDVVPVRTAAENNGVPYSFARAIQRDLMMAGIIDTTRGIHGGMRLIIDPKKTTLADVIEAVQGPIRINTCDVAGPDGGPCPFLPLCKFNPVFCEAQRILYEYFSSVTLWQLIKDNIHPILGSEHPFKLVEHQPRA